MADQMSIPVTEPQGELAPAIPNTDGTPTFGDMPEARGWVPKIQFADDSPEEEVQEPEPAPRVPDAPTAPPPVVSAQPQPANAGQDFFQAFVAYDQWKEQQQAERQRQQASANFAPPEIPDTLSEAMLTDPKVNKTVLEERDKWHRNATVKAIEQAVTPLAQEVQSLRTQQQETNYRDHSAAWNDVRESLSAQGVDADKYYGQIIQSLQSNPQTFWTIAKNPRALVSAVKFLRDGEAEDNSTFTAAPERTKAPPTAGSSAAPPRATAASTKTHPAIQKAEQAFGKKFSKEAREEFFKNIGAGR